MNLLCIIVFGVLISAEASLVNENVYEETRFECRELRGSVCADHFGLATWYGRFPNAIGMSKDDSVVDFFNFFALLYQDNYCSHMLHNLLCFHYFPFCSPSCPDSSVTPSRQLCTEAVKACLPYARVLYGGAFENHFPKFLNCTSFPEANSSIGYCLLNSHSNGTDSCCSATEGEVHLNLPNSSEFLKEYIQRNPQLHHLQIFTLISAPLLEAAYTRQWKMRAHWRYV